MEHRKSFAASLLYSGYVVSHLLCLFQWPQMTVLCTDSHEIAPLTLRSLWQGYITTNSQINVTHSASSRLHCKKLSLSACCKTSGLVFSSHCGLIHTNRKYAKQTDTAARYEFYLSSKTVHHLRGMRRSCLFSSWSFLIRFDSSGVKRPALASAGTNLMLSFSKIKKQLCKHQHMRTV